MNDYETMQVSPPPRHFWRDLKRSTRRTLILLLCILLLFAAGCILTAQHTKKAADEKYRADIEAAQAEAQKWKDDYYDLVDNPVVIEPVTPEVDLSVISSEIKTKGELVTAEYCYTDANRYTDAKEVLGITLPFTKKSFVMKWDGVIKAGIDIIKASVEKDEEQKLLTIHLPAPKIISHEILSDSVITVDEKGNIFNPISVDDVNSLYAVSKEAMEQRAQEHGLLEQAESNAQSQLTNFLYKMPDVSYYTLTFCFDA